MKNTLKPKVPALNRVPKAFLEEQKENGLAGLVEPTEEERGNLQEWAAMVWELIESTMQKFPYPVAGLYLYDHTQCRGEYGNVAGMCSFQHNLSTGGKRSIIGLDIEPVRRGGSYLAFLLLHEIAHAATAAAGHGDRYHQYLNYLLRSFNTEYGTSLVNDYVGD